MSAATARRARLDQLLVDRGLVDTRTRAQALVMAGRVRVGAGDAARTDRKPGDLIDDATQLTVVEPEPYVSRGGYKLAAALDAFAIDPTDRICIDTGASTGGFTDVLLQRGARRVYAVDVGRGQLAERLKHDARVVSMERTNARHLTPSSLPEAVDLAVIDVSFISLALVLGPVASCFGSTGGDVVALVKPQFEAGRSQVKDGVVRDPGIHLEVLRKVVAHARDVGLRPVGVIPSPITGPEGNREFLLYLVIGARTAAPDLPDDRLTEVVAS